MRGHAGAAVGRDAAGDACCRNVAGQCRDPACPVLCRRWQCLAFHGVELACSLAVTSLVGAVVEPRRSGSGGGSQALVGSVSSAHSTVLHQIPAPPPHAC